MKGMQGAFFLAVAIMYTGCPNTNKHNQELRPGHGDEGDVGLGYLDNSGCMY
jgi:hypothetical protein